MAVLTPGLATYVLPPAKNAASTRIIGWHEIMRFGTTCPMARALAKWCPLPHARPRKVITVVRSSSMHSGMRVSVDGVLARGRHEEEEEEEDDDDDEKDDVMAAFMPKARRSQEA